MEILELENIEAAKEYAKQIGRPIVAGLLSDSKVWKVYPTGRTEYRCEAWTSLDEARRVQMEQCHLYRGAEAQEEQEGERARYDQAYVVCAECGTAHFVINAYLTEEQSRASLEKAVRALAKSLQKPN